MKILFTIEETQRQIVITYRYLWAFIIFQASGVFTIISGSHNPFILTIGIIYLTIGLIGIIPYFVHTSRYKKMATKLRGPVISFLSKIHSS